MQPPRGEMRAQSLGRRGALLPSSFGPLPFLSLLGLASFVWLQCQPNVVPVVQPISASLGLSSCTTNRASITILVRSRAVRSCSRLLFLHSCQDYCSTVTSCSHNICSLIVSKGNFLLWKFSSFFFFFLINLTLDKCLTTSHYKPISLCKALVSPKGPPSLKLSNFYTINFL